MYSMTGYGSGVAEADNRKISIELKSVNHRFLDLSIKIPRILNPIEELVRNVLKSRLQRGHIDVNINYSSKAADDYNITVNHELCNKYLTLAGEISKRYDIACDMTVSKIFEVRDVLVFEDASVDENVLTSLTDKALCSAIDNLIIMRESEGGRIKTDLMEKIENISRVVGEIKQYAPAQIDNYRIALRDRVAEALKDVAVDENKLMNEVVFYADKVAVDEEFTRLFAHIGHFKEILSKNEAIGRQLDFVVQEMNREANTIGSKCSDIKLANHVVSLKTDIEKIREQIQNIE